MRIYVQEFKQKAYEKGRGNTVSWVVYLQFLYWPKAIL
jgi:hypothetical protein